MRRFVVGWVALVAVAAVLAGTWPDLSATAQDTDKDATIAALQTRVARLEGAGTAPAAVSPAASPALSAPAGASGPAQAGLPEGEAGKIAIVATGPYQQNRVPIVVRNNTGRAVAYIEVAGDVRDADGRVTEVVRPRQLYPLIVEPGGLAIGYLYFDQEVRPTDKVSLTATGHTDVGSWRDFGAIPVELVEFNNFGDRVTGSIRNPTNQTTTDSAFIGLVCFDQSGTPAYAAQGSVPKGIEPHGIGAFEFDNIPFSCDRYLFAGYSYAR